MYTKNFQIGQKIHCSLYGGMDGYITEIIGEQSPDTCKTLGGGIGVMGGRADLRVCFKDHFSNIPESLARSSVQWTVYDTVISQSELDKKIAAAKSVMNKAEQARIDKAAAKQAEELRQRTAPEYRHLTPVDGYNDTAVAKNIRAELKKSFPGVKFSVRKQYHGSIYVTWIDGPFSDTVRSTLENFSSYGGTRMDDSRINKSHAWIFGTVEHLSCQRTSSDDAIRTAIERINKYYGVNGTFEQSKQFGALPEIYSNDRSNGRDFEDEIHKVLSGKKDYEAIERHQSREAEVKTILSAQFGFVGYFYKQSSPTISIFFRNDAKWAIGDSYDYPTVDDDYTTPAQTIAEQINAAYDAEVIRDRIEREARELRDLEMSRDIIPLSIEYPNRLLTVTFPALDKNDTLEYNDQQILDEPRPQNCEVRKLITLSDDDFKRLGESLMNSRPELLSYECTSYIDDKYLVDLIEHTPQYYETWRVYGITTVIEVRCSTDCFYIDTSGYDYARYVGRDDEGIAKIVASNIISQLSSELTH